MKIDLVMDSMPIKDIREEVKQYIDHADEKVVKMVHAMLEVNAEGDWWNTMPENIKSDVENALLLADKGDVLSHEQVVKKHPQWFTK